MSVHQDQLAGTIVSESPPALHLAQRLVDDRLRRAVAQLHPDLAHICAYHFGWRTADGRPVGPGSSKLLRATLTVLAAQATGSPADVAVPGAVAVELIHNFSLLHDDIMDADERRRGRPTAWVVFSPGLATLAGDALIAAAFASLDELPRESGWAASKLLTGALDRMICGQAADLALETRGVDEVGLEHYLPAAAKTTALLETSLAIGAVLGGADPATVATLRQAGQSLGLAWQVANDVEDIWGDPDATGKPAMSDLRRSKKTIPVILALRSGTAAAAMLAESMRSPDRPTDEVLGRQADLIESAGGRARSEELSQQHLDAAVEHLVAAGLPPEVTAELAELFRFVVDRSV